MILIISLFLVISLIGSAYLVTFRGYTISDLLVLALFLFPLLFLGRFSVAFKIKFLGHWYLGFELCAAVLLVFFLLVKLLSSASGKMRMFYLVFLLTSLLLVGLASGLINGTSLIDFGAAIQASFRWFIPFLLACVAISTLPKTPESNARLVDSYILVYGIITPLLILVSALFTRQLAGLMGWDPYAVSEAAGAGFTRGWTPTGSGMTSGILVLFAYSMALARLIRKHRTVFNAFVTALCVVSILFTLARSVMISLVFFHILAFRVTLWRNLSRVLISFLLILILVAPAMIFLSSRYGFERFFLLGGESVQIRWYSALAGLKLGSEKPLLGQGPAQLYWDVRQPRMMSGTIKEKVITIRNLPSAKEPHNLYILTFAETGLIGLTLLVAALLFWLHRLNTVRKYALYVPEYLLETNAHWSMLIAFAFYHLTDSGIFLYPKVALTMWLSLLVGLHSAATVENQVWASAQYDDLARDNDYEIDQVGYSEIPDSQYVEGAYYS
ncbi:MAG: O-antigen ligase family protein [Planctomycetes bacterium]|nr:O-antigen ligase family protein [Planctomycetota bacterium]